MSDELDDVRQLYQEARNRDVPLYCRAGEEPPECRAVCTKDGDGRILDPDCFRQYDNLGPETRHNLAKTPEPQRRPPDVSMNRTVVVPEGEGTKLMTVLHRDGAATVIRIEPHPDGVELHIELGWKKVLHDLVIHRHVDDSD
jgi:hypothetical protein